MIGKDIFISSSEYANKVELVKRSANGGGVILVKSKKDADAIRAIAYALSLEIRPPVTIDAFEMYYRGREFQMPYLIEDAHFLLEKFLKENYPTAQCTGYSIRYRDNIFNNKSYKENRMDEPKEYSWQPPTDTYEKTYKMLYVNSVDRICGETLKSHGTGYQARVYDHTGAIDNSYIGTYMTAEAAQKAVETYWNRK